MKLWSAFLTEFGSLDKVNNIDTNFWRKYMVYNRDRLNNVLRPDKQYYDACVSRPYIALKDVPPCKDFHLVKIKMIYAVKKTLFIFCG